MYKVFEPNDDEKKKYDSYYQAFSSKKLDTETADSLNQCLKKNTKQFEKLNLCD